MLKTVLFDLDGTLLDTEPDFTLILNELLEQHERKAVSADQVRKTVSDGARALIKLGFEITEENPNFTFLLNNLLKLYLERIPKTSCTLFDGISTLLESLTLQNINWGIVTNKPTRFTLPLVEKFPTLNSCAVIICPDDVAQAKPDPEGLLLACNKTSSLPAETIYIGDHIRDIEAGINAHMKTVAVSWGYISNEIPIYDWQADMIVSTPLELQHYLLNNTH